MRVEWAAWDVSDLMHEARGWWRARQWGNAVEARSDLGLASPAPMLDRVASSSLLQHTIGARGAGTLRALLAAGVACMARRFNSKLVPSPDCPHCDLMVEVPNSWPPRWQRAPETLWHKLWECPAWQGVRGAVQPPDGDTEGTTGLVCHPRVEPGGRLLPALAQQAQAPAPRQCAPQLSGKHSKHKQWL